MISNGMFEYWNRNEFRRIKNLNSSKKNSDNSNAPIEDGDLIKPLKMVNLQSAYYFFLIGICVSVLSIFIEVILFFLSK